MMSGGVCGLHLLRGVGVECCRPANSPWIVVSCHEAIPSVRRLEVKIHSLYPLGIWNLADEAARITVRHDIWRL
jgi:hypothetical protein